jgi:hypothetical protein
MNYIEAQLIGITETNPDLYVMETMYSLLYQVRASNGMNVGTDTIVHLLEWVWRIGWKSPEIAVPMVMIAGYVYKTNQNKKVAKQLIAINNSFRISTIGILAEEFLNG